MKSDQQMVVLEVNGIEDKKTSLNALFGSFVHTSFLDRKQQFWSGILTD